MTKTPLMLFCLLAGILAGHRSAHAGPTPPTCGATIYASVSLTADLVCPPGTDGIVIGADNLRVDLNGYAITTQFVWGTRGVSSMGFSGIKVFGPGRVDNFGTGVEMSGGGYQEIREVEFASPSQTSITLRDTFQATVEGNRTELISVSSNPASRSDENRIVGNRATTVWIAGCNTTNTEVSSNDFRARSIFVAVGMDPGSRRTRVVANRITGGSIYIGGSSENLVESNTVILTAATSSYSGVVIGSNFAPCGAYAVTPAVENTVRYNSLQGGSYGVLFTAGAYKNEARDNKVTGPGMAAFFFAAGADDNDARGNWLSNTSTPAVDMGQGNLWP